MDPIIEVIVPTYKRPEFLLLLVQSFKVQTFNNWKLTVIIDGKDDTKSIDVMRNINEENISYTVINGPNNDWGHTAREYGLRHTTSEWILMTGDDNYYVPTFIEYFTFAIKKNPNAILHYCNLISGNTNTKLYPLDINYYLMDSKILRGQIDISCFITKTELARVVGFPSRAYSADFDYLDLYLKTFGKYAFSVKAGSIVYNNINKINKYLCVHN